MSIEIVQVLPDSDPPGATLKSYIVHYIEDEESKVSGADEFVNLHPLLKTRLFKLMYEHKYLLEDTRPVNPFKEVRKNES